MKYYNGFSDIGVKFENGKGYYFHGMSPWIETNVSEGLIKSLAYYKKLNEYDIPMREKSSFSTSIVDNKDLLMEKFNALS
ncbi:hypothetical protein [Klebsiella phage phiKp_21]|uniref:Uncharacterized protein n=1 Tax=Klebsiella phage vB_KleM_RaK2 TaxID=1147094 RepID=H6X407_9CAUD|nr:hypothetical protein F403_gp335 [Klebsiella phage vB_KleM_RaK2]YP_010843127.1 hypothetical protein ACQ27_gp243 [Klebsiella phage K64-1]QOE32613.1 hypothetical protein CPT_Muenster_441 [Klebsiella phage Muenster]UYL05095.1 hypothetical protein DIDNDMLP_00104 [Klebsiella phage KP13-7]BEH88069.1 hypothetical protein [Klebsiella phage phiKp_21]AFA44473.1 hypothetical protein RaK2_00200 [Klebsiella phage vB_KleM_RaK2]